MFWDFLSLVLKVLRDRPPLLGYTLYFPHLSLKSLWNQSGFCSGNFLDVYLTFQLINTLSSINLFLRNVSCGNTVMNHFLSWPTCWWRNYCASRLVQKSNRSINHFWKICTYGAVNDGGRVSHKNQRKRIGKEVGSFPLKNHQPINYNLV